MGRRVILNGDDPETSGPSSSRIARFDHIGQSGADVFRAHVVLAHDVIKLMPPARLPTMTETGMRVPAITGLPWKISASIVIRLLAAMLFPRIPHVF
jgi:hypothetical protein